MSAADTSTPVVEIERRPKLFRKLKKFMRDRERVVVAGEDADISYVIMVAKGGQ